MTFQVRIAALAQRQIDEFAAYLRGYSEDFAAEQGDRLDQIFSNSLRDSPLTWNYFAFTGAPYRAYLFRVGRRTHYWIIYTVNEDTRTVDVLNFWNVRRDPDKLDL
jgi:mRNA-degrading endonuclease RelE of RelBE toxin-antitoxin system